MAATSDSNIEPTPSNITITMDDEKSIELLDKSFKVVSKGTIWNKSVQLLLSIVVFAALLTVCFTVYPFWYVWVAVCVQAFTVIGAILCLILTFMGTLTTTFRMEDR